MTPGSEPGKEASSVVGGGQGEGESRDEAGRGDQFLECQNVGRKFSGLSIIHVQ